LSNRFERSANSLIFLPVRWSLFTLFCRSENQGSLITLERFTGRLTRDFQLFFKESVSPGALSIPLGSFQLFLKSVNECLSTVSTTPALYCSAVPTTPLTNLPPANISLPTPENEK
jgi:hypothetical protein